MRDGTILRADIYRPSTPEPVPAVVCRTPYDINHSMVPMAGLDPERAVPAGFAAVFQTVRGRYASEGTFYPFVNERSDGYDTIEWVASQPWCTGAIGMAGRSYGGVTQWLAALEQPPHLKAIFPTVIGSDFYHNWIYQGGAFHLGFNLFWALLIHKQRESNKTNNHVPHLPLSTVPVLREIEAARWYFDWMEHPAEDDYWKALSIRRGYDRIRVPAYNVGAWYDVFISGTLENFSRLQQEGSTEEVRKGARLLMGPWAHGTTYNTYPDHAFPQFEGIDQIDTTEEQLRFFRYHLKGEASGIGEQPPVRIFIMGENAWRYENEWPLARTRYTPWYLHSRSSGGEWAGALSLEAPGEEPPDAYTYDPSDPAPSVGGITSVPGMLFGMDSGPKDQKRVESRPDVLAYTSEPLTEPVEVTGPIRASVFVATDAPDTDFVVKLTDVHPDGSSIILAEGVRRLRFRDSFEHPTFAEPGKVYEVQVDMAATSNLFRSGHRIRILVTSSSFPRFDRNPNTGDPLGTDDPDDLRAARQTVFHDGERPSSILLPVIPR